MTQNPPPPSPQSEPTPPQGYQELQGDREYQGGYPQPSYPQPGYPAPSYPPPGFPRQPVKTSTKGPTAMLVVGIVCLVLGVLGGVAAVVGGIGIGANTPTTIARSGELDADGTVTFADLQLQGGQQYMVASWSSSPAGKVTVRQGATGDGAEVDTTAAPSGERTTIDSRTYHPVVLFQPKDSGTYQVTVEPSASGESSYRTLLVSTYAPTTALALSVIGLTFGILTAVLLFPVGLGLTIAGAIWRSRRNRNAKLVAQGTAAEIPS